MNKVQGLFAAGRLQEAFNLLKASSGDPVLKNALGVCLLRMGQAEQAVRVYRELCLASGGIVLRQEVPIVWKTNFATALLLSGNISGCASVLHELAAPNDPHVRQLAQAIASWKSQLSGWQRLLWWLGSVPNRPIVVDFPWGALE